MKNKDKYEDKINNYDGDYFCNDFVKPIILKSNDCDGMCCKCRLLQAIWLEKEYEEPEVDWTKVDIDTPILVRDSKFDTWSKMYFAGYMNGKVHSWFPGNTSITTDNVLPWKYAKLAETKKYEKVKETKVDWDKVAVDTPILMKDDNDYDWHEAHFACYKKGRVWAWYFGKTSETENRIYSCKHATLAEPYKGRC